jgi:hypothetical protein
MIRRRALYAVAIYRRSGGPQIPAGRIGVSSIAYVTYELGD